VDRLGAQFAGNALAVRVDDFSCHGIAVCPGGDEASASRIVGGVI